MKLQKLIKSALTVMGLALVAVGAQAQTVREFASANGGDGTFIYTQSVNGVGGGLAMTQTGFATTLDFPSANTQTNKPATVMFTGLKNNGVTTINAGDFKQLLTGGTFSLTDTVTSQLLLSGAFDAANLTGTIGTNASGVNTNFINVTYNGGSYATAANIALLTTAGNSFNFSLLNAKPLLSNSSGNLNSFSSAGNGQFTGTSAVPEPASVIPFVLGGLGLLGLIARKTRRTNGVAA